VDRGAVLGLLEQASLPTADLDEPAAVQFWIAMAVDRLVGAIGLERHGTDGLLRSLVVAPDHRSRGVGHALVAALERDARLAGIGQLVLLTQTAKPYFERLGFEVVARDTVPGPVQASAEFRSLCPASAVCMTKHLQQAGTGARNG
jgi:amino-acid N-acetyltransferase